MYLFETHCHTSQGSPCGHMSGRELAEAYAKAGFSGIIVTDHYTSRYMGSMPRSTWEGVAELWLAGYNEAKTVGAELGLTVLLGAELQLNSGPNEYLLYGINEEFIYKFPKLYEYSLDDLRELCDENGILIFQAHPMRAYVYPEDVYYLDGVEVYNGNPRHNSKNEQAEAFADDNQLLISAGSDCHQPQDVGMSGIVTKTPITNMEELLGYLENGDFSIIKNLKAEEK